jgi:NADH-quinone oxidoreductase subunit H
LKGFSFKLFSISSVGLLQPFSDGLKLFTKEIIFPINANTNIFLFSPALSFILSLIN